MSVTIVSRNAWSQALLAGAVVASLVWAIVSPVPATAAEVNDATPTAEQKAPPQPKDGGTTVDASGTKPNEGQPKYNPLLPRNNPRARVYALSLRTPVLVEIGLAKRAAELSEEETKALTEKVQDVLFDVSVEYATRNGKLNAGSFYPAPYEYSDVSKSEWVVGPLMAKVQKTLLEEMSPPQREKYQTAIDERAKSKREACIAIIIARLDMRLVLAAEQRRKISAEISKIWDPNWEDCAALQSSYHHYSIPKISDEAVVPHLDADQKAIWEAMEKYDGRSSWGMSGPGAADPIPGDVPWDENRHL